MSLPTISIIGTLGRLQTTHTTTGKEVTKFQIECSEKNAKGEYDNLYLKGEVWEKASQFLNSYFKEGDVAVVTGKLITNVYEKNGAKVYENKLSFPSVSFPPKAKASQGQQSQPKQYQKQVANIPDIDDDQFVPFWDRT
mgnify:CR=1 FL=1